MNSMAQKYAKYLITSFEIQIGLGLLAAFPAAFLVFVMAGAAPNSTIFHSFIGGIIGFFGTLIAISLLPSLAQQELKRYDSKNCLLFNYIFTLVMGISFPPLGLWHAYILYRLKKSLNGENEQTKDNSFIDNSVKFALTLFSIISSMVSK